VVGATERQSGSGRGTERGCAFTCLGTLIVYRARALGPPQITPEEVEVGAFAVDQVPWDDLAFWSTALALRDAFPD
jgi:hypothetical protein